MHCVPYYPRKEPSRVIINKAMEGRQLRICNNKIKNTSIEVRVGPQNRTDLNYLFLLILIIRCLKSTENYPTDFFARNSVAGSIPMGIEFRE